MIHGPDYRVPPDLVYVHLGGISVWTAMNAWGAEFLLKHCVNNLDVIYPHVEVNKKMHRKLLRLVKKGYTYKKRKPT